MMYRKRDYATRAARALTIGTRCAIAESPYIPGGQPLSGEWIVTRFNPFKDGNNWAVLVRVDDGAEVHLPVVRLDPA